MTLQATASRVRAQLLARARRRKAGRQRRVVGNREKRPEVETSGPCSYLAFF